MALDQGTANEASPMPRFALGDSVLWRGYLCTVVSPPSWRCWVQEYAYSIRDHSSMLTVAVKESELLKAEESLPN